MLAIQINAYGGPENLKLNTVKVPKPGPTEVLVRLAYSGLNFMDVYTRAGVYANSSPYQSSLPLTLGMEGSGWVEAVGSEVASFSRNDRVVFCLTRGSYAEYICVPESKLVKLPETIGLDVAAALYFQGLTAHYLTHDTFRIKEGDQCVVYSASGGVAQLIVQIAKTRNATVIAVVSSEDKKKVVQRLGADFVSLNHPDQIIENVRAATGELGASVLYDSVGADLYETSLKLLKRKGMYVYYGSNSGPLPPIDAIKLANCGSLFFTRPRLNVHIFDRQELESRSRGLFDLIEQGAISPSISHVYSLSEVKEGHIDLEQRKTIGKSIIKIN